MKNWLLSANRRIAIYSVTALLFLLLFSPYLIKGKNVHIEIHDTLDAVNEVGIFNKTFDGYFFTPPKADNKTMPGVHPIFFVQPLSIDRLFYALFGFFWGFVVNEGVYRILAFIGMYLLLKRFDRIGGVPGVLRALMAFTFAALPFFPLFNATVAGIPFLILLFVTVYDPATTPSRRKLLYLALFVFSFYASLVHCGIFFLALLFPVIVFLWFKKKAVAPLLIGAAVLTAGWVISNYSMFLMKFMEQIPTTREEMKASALYGTGVWDILKSTWNMYLHSGFHARSLHVPFLLPVSVLMGIYLGWKKQFTHFRWALLLFIFPIAAALANGLYVYKPFLDFYESLRIGISLSRFYLLSPSAWYLLFGVILLDFYNSFASKKRAFVLVLLIISVQLGINAHAYSWRAMKGYPHFAAFFSEDQFERIKRDLHLTDKDRVGCIGFYPSVANYNGLRTVGAYKNFYELKFKRDFYEVIRGELDLNKPLERYFLLWGSRAYLFDNEIGTMYDSQYMIRKRLKTIESRLNMDKLKEMGVNYIISTVSIGNAAEKQLRLVWEEDRPDYYYRFFVYRL